MAHPTQSFPKGFYDINEASATATESFYAITCYVAGNIEVQGGGRFEYVNIDAASASDVVKYIDPSTGQAYVDEAAANGDATGFYEKIPTSLWLASSFCSLLTKAYGLHLVPLLGNNDVRLLGMIRSPFGFVKPADSSSFKTRISL